MDNQIYVAQLNVLFLFCKLLFEVKKIDTLKKKFILMFFGSVYPTRLSDTVNKYAIYPSRFPYFISGKIFQMVLGLILQLAIPWLEKPGSQMPYLVLFDLLIFYLLIFGVSYSKNPKNLKTYVFGRLFFDMQISRSCH